MIEREQATEIEIEKAFAALREGVERRIRKHGRGKWVSIHESLGIMTEEYDESKDEVHKNDTEKFVEEMIDCAITGIWAHVSLHQERVVDPCPGCGVAKAEHNNVSNNDGCDWVMGRRGWRQLGVYDG